MEGEYTCVVQYSHDYQCQAVETDLYPQIPDNYWIQSEDTNRLTE